MSSNERYIKSLLDDRNERLKELACINQTTAILKEGKPIEESLHQIVLILPHAWQYPEFTVSRIRFDESEYKSQGFRETEWVIKQSFLAIDGSSGEIEIFYTREFAEIYEGPFLKEERDLIDNICSLLLGYINSFKAKQIMFKSKSREDRKRKRAESLEKVANSRQLLGKFLNKHNAERDLFHDLMPFKVKEILLISTLYDAYTIEKDGRFADHVLGQFHQLNLSSLPRVTGVTKLEEALEELEGKHYDMVIVMMGVDKITPLEISRNLKEAYSYIPIFFLLNNSKDIEIFSRQENSVNYLNRVFVWNGDPKMFFAMVKLLEDQVNVENDTTMGFTKVILLVEDSPKYYSRYLPMIYSIVLEQTKHLIEDVNTDELYKVLKLRGRPKILLASNFEDAMEIFNLYKDYVLCVISDVSFPRKGKIDNLAGVDFIRHVKSQIENLPAILQSANPECQKFAHELRAVFVNKDSETLLQDLKSFITYFLGFGHFVYRDNEGRQIAVAKSMREFEAYLKTVPQESLVYHAVKNHFSLWLMARGEVKIARIINPLKISDFDSPEEMRKFLTDIIASHRNEQDRGKIVNFEESAVLDESNIVSFSTGSLGGKGRGLAFINTLIYNFGFSDLISGLNIRTPVTGIIGTDEFDVFLEMNKLYEIAYQEESHEAIRTLFIKGKLSYNIEKKLRIFLKLVKNPIAIRSSSLFEDSLSQPFSGVFETYLLPNNHESFEVRLEQTMNAIKLVYASIFSDNAKTYFEAISNKIEEEKMAIVIQEVVGNCYDNCFYPHISGTAQSHNYYPYAHMKPEEGFSVMAVGLGQYVVDGEKSYRFSPMYPDIEIVSARDQYKNSQLNFYAVNLAKPDIDLLEGESAGLIKLDISKAEIDGTLKHCASVYDAENEMVVAGIENPGPRVINFANILKYDYIPLAKSLTTILDFVKEALGCPVEIEFAVDLNKTENNLPSFYLLQIKPLFGVDDDFIFNQDDYDPDTIILKSGKSMGNGKIDNITDVIFVKPDKFDKLKTREIAVEIDKLNRGMMESGKRYVLIGPGRWGTQDRFIGIPVVWNNISNAAVIVEMSMEGFPLDASLGSHFFHNLTARNIGYLSVNHLNPEEFVRVEKFAGGETVNDTSYCRHVRFLEPLQILMDGKKGVAVITETGK